MKRAIPAIWILTLALGPLSASGTTVEALDTDELATRATTIVTGKVVDIESQWEGRMVVTDVHVEVATCMKGSCDERLVSLRVLGGEVGDLAMRVDGVASFALGEEVMLFLEPAGVQASERLRTTGLAQGKFSLRREGDRLWASRDLSHLRLFERGVTRRGDREQVELQLLVSRVRAVLAF